MRENVPQGAYSAPTYADGMLITQSFGTILYTTTLYKYVTPAKLEEAMETVGDTMTLSSTTPGSSKKFRLTVDDEGTIKAEEVTA